jgi:hypothetical protein
MNTPLFQFVMLALVVSIHVLDTACDEWSKDVDGRDKPDHDEEMRCSWIPGSQLRCAPERRAHSALCSFASGKRATSASNSTKPLAWNSAVALPFSAVARLASPAAPEG